MEMSIVCGHSIVFQTPVHKIPFTQDKKAGHTDEEDLCSLSGTSKPHPGSKTPTVKSCRLYQTETTNLISKIRRPSAVSMDDNDFQKKTVTGDKANDTKTKSANWISSLDFPNRRRIRTALSMNASKTDSIRIESNIRNHSKLLYLRDDGHSTPRPTSIWSQNGHHYHNNNKASRGPSRIDCHDRDINDRLSRNCFSTYNQLLAYGLERSTHRRRHIPSEERKQRYIDEVIDTYLSKRSPNANTNQGRKDKVKSAPVRRPQALDTQSDNLIGMFEWTKMSRLRRRMGEDLQAVKHEEMVFRDKVRVKKNRAKKRLLVITRIFLAIQFWSTEKTIRSAAELQWFTLNSSTEAKTLAFNKELFTQARAQAKVPGWAIHIMLKLPPKRTEKECRKLHALMRGLKSFEKFTERIQLAMCRSIIYENVESMRIILRKGHIGLNFYFIYSGSVFVNVDDVDAKGKMFVTTEVILSRGDSFGEIALLQEVARTATVSARETCELLTVDREVFSTLCPQIFDKELEEKIEFLQTVPLFQCRGWTEETKRNLCFQAHIQEGKCKIIRHLQFEGTSTELPDSWQSDDEDLEAEISNLLTPGVENGTSHSAGRGPSGSERGRRKSFQKDKGRLLQSMGLAYVDSTQKLAENKPTKDGCTQRDPPKQFALTLTTLINQTIVDTGKINSVFLDIGTLDVGDVFDLQSSLNRKTTQSDSKLILVSGGASLLRVKRNKLFQFANEDCLQHAQTIASQNRHPSERILLRSYKEKENWDHYKDRVVKEILRLDMGASWAENCQALSELRQIELEHQTKRLLTAYSKKSDRKLSTSYRQDRKVIDMDTLGAFILGVTKWKTRTAEKIRCDKTDSDDDNLDSGANKGSNSDSVVSSPRIPTIIIN